LAATVFIAGTDTGVGKTRVACALLRALRARGVRVCGFKPVASGCVATREGLRNEDALALQDAAGTAERYERINPYAFAPAIAPHLAAAAADTRIRVSRLVEAHAALASAYDLILVEGAGGWKVPLDETWTMAEFVAEQEWPVILVVGMRLGCINHALLTADAIMRSTRLLGWIANVLPPEPEALKANLDSLVARLSAPLLGVVAANARDEVVARALDCSPLQALAAPARPRLAPQRT
jgi:dethiobiotin synthetase